MADAKELKRYIRAPLFKFWFFLIGHVVLALIIAGASFSARGIEILFPILMLLYLLYRIVCIAAEIGAAGREIKKMQEQGALERVVEDFNRAQKYLGDNLRLGEYCVFGKAAGMVLVYPDIERVYPHTVRTNIGKYSFLCVKSKTYGELKVCSINGWQKTEALNETLQSIANHNPQIQIGKA